VLTKSYDVLDSFLSFAATPSRSNRVKRTTNEEAKQSTKLRSHLRPHFRGGNFRKAWSRKDCEWLVRLFSASVRPTCPLETADSIIESLFLVWWQNYALQITKKFIEVCRSWNLGGHEAEDEDWRAGIVPRPLLRARTIVLMFTRPVVLPSDLRLINEQQQPSLQLRSIPSSRKI
jgi:hypothetical protein